MLKKILLAISVSVLFAAAAFAQATTAASSAVVTAPTPEKSTKPPIFRPTKDQILQVQKILKEKKLYSGDANGTYNDPTREGIKSFQKDNGLKETGTLNRATLEKFGVALTDKQKLIPVSPNSFATPPAPTNPARVPKDKPVSSTSTTGDAKTTGDAVKKPTIFRASVDQIKAAQKMLKEKSMYSGGETGKLDDDTRNGLKKFQEANGVKSTGTLNAATLEKMGIPLTDNQKATMAAAPKN